MQAIGVTITLNSFFQQYKDIEYLKKESEKLFSDILLNEYWEGVAFIAVYDLYGTVVLHSNPQLIGSQIQLNLYKENPNYYFYELGTGERIFISDSKIKLNGIPCVLRVALHVFPVESVLRSAKFHVFLMSGIGILLILGGGLSIFLINKIERMQVKIKDLETIYFLSQVLAHEIRNPLGSIKGYAQYLKSKMECESFHEYIDVIINESLKLEKLTNELQDFANPPKLHFELFNLKELLFEVVDKFKTRYENIKFELKCEDTVIRSDKRKLEQILENLIQNAVDAVLESKEKHIFAYSESLNDKIRIVIQDTGVGMDDVTLSRITEPFFTTKPSGSGLGLAIVKKFSEALNISFDIKSVKGKGTKVWLTLPK